jgi:ubiquinone/menaquinone biosynthesis C-methylase UbiE
LSYHSTVQDFYQTAAEQPQESLCCVPSAPRYLPDLVIPQIMHEMNYGCGTTIHLQDMAQGQHVAYVGVGGGLEALQLAYFTRYPGGVIAVDPVEQMRTAAARNLEQAAQLNDWFDPSFVDIRDGDARDLPLDDASVDLAAQNCLFNIFKSASTDTAGDLEVALGQMHRVLKPEGRLVMSDPIASRTMPEHLQKDEMLRAKCLSGCQTYGRYIDTIVEAGFGGIEVRSRRPYRMLDRARYDLDENLLLESVEVAAFKVPVPSDGPCVFTGRTAVYFGDQASFDDGRGHVLTRNTPHAVCDKTATALASLEHPDITITPSTWHYAGDGCC